MTISEHIHNHLQLGHQPRDISPLEDLEDFFGGFPNAEEEQWPLAPFDDQMKVSYSEARVVSDRFGFQSFVNLTANVKLPSAELIIAENITYDDNLQIELSSIFRSKGNNCSSFVFEFIRRHRNLVKNFDKMQARHGVVTKSEMILDANSDPKKKPVRNGGYTWAVQGFDFATPHEAETARQAFARFALEHGVQIEDKDLKLFTKPCHFAAFQCGVKAEGKNLGKAFLLQYSWRARMQVPLTGSEPEEYRFAKVYNENRANGNYAALAVGTLNKKYLRMMQKYYQKYAVSRQKKKGILSRLSQKALLAVGFSQSM